MKCALFQTKDPVRHCLLVYMIIRETLLHHQESLVTIVGQQLFMHIHNIPLSSKKIHTKA